MAAPSGSEGAEIVEQLHISTEDGELDPEKAAKKAAREAEKAAKAAAKAARAAQRGQKQAVSTEADPDDPLKDHYGDTALVQSAVVSGRAWTDVPALTPALAGQRVLVRGRVHTVRGKGKSAFLVLRQQTATVQAVLFVDDVSVTDAARGAAAVAAAAAAGEQVVTVQQDTRLDNRFIDLRTPANQAIFRMQSAVTQLFREALLSEGFVEIHTPKLLSGASEGGAAVFNFDYMGRPGCLAQSPQFYKQMAICSDFGRVFEVGPVFRAENSYTHRHLCEFTGLDMEMAIHETYQEGLRSRCARELDVIGQQFPFEPFAHLPTSLRLTFEEGIKLLQEAGYDVDPFGDLNTELERALGRIVKERYGTDFYMLHRYPLAIRPFYTMPCQDDPRYSCSFDIFMRGEEIISGAQRIHDPALLRERAEALGIPVDTIQSYIDSFKYGAPPHGGAGVGLERVVMLYAGDKGAGPGPGPLLTAAAGALAGAVSRFVVGPLDVLKIRFQVQLEPIGGGAAASKYTSLRQARALATIVREEGVRGLWRGTIPGQLLTVPYCAVQFLALRQCKALAAAYGLGADSRWGVALSFVSGAAAGAAGTVASYPFDLLRTTLAAQGEPKVYWTMTEAARSIYAQHGLKGLYRGLGLTVLEIIPYAALQFGLYDMLMRAYTDARVKLERQRRGAGLPPARRDSTSPTSLQCFLCGLAAGTLAKLGTHPLDVVKKRYQVAGLPRSTRYGQRIPAAAATRPLGWLLRDIAAREGLAGLYKGAGPSILKAAPSAAVTFVVYEFLIRLGAAWQAAQAQAGQAPRAERRRQPPPQQQQREQPQPVQRRRHG
eukprot:scaffold11.g3958.t1